MVLRVDERSEGDEVLHGVLLVVLEVVVEVVMAYFGNDFWA